MSHYISFNRGSVVHAADNAAGYNESRKKRKGTCSDYITFAATSITVSQILFFVFSICNMQLSICTGVKIFSQHLCLVLSALQIYNAMLFSATCLNPFYLRVFHVFLCWLQYILFNCIIDLKFLTYVSIIVHHVGLIRIRVLRIFLLILLLFSLCNTTSMSHCSFLPLV